MQAPLASELSIDRCNVTKSSAALELAARAWPASEKDAYAAGIQQAIEIGNAGSVVLLAARHGEQLIAAQLAQMLAGRAALIWPPQFIGGSESPNQAIAAAALGLKLAVELKDNGIGIAQSLIAPGDDDHEKWLAIGGLSHAADLLYLAADANLAPSVATLSPFDLEAFQPTATERLIAVIQRTYVGTLDCPTIDGLRDTADVITGYQSVGAYRPELWFFVREQNRDVGCLLINLHPDVQHAEIVYLALVPEVRGRGWGLQLAKQALWLARATHCQRAVLAVDASNAPAVALYRAAGFEMFDRRAVWLRTFHDAS